jgi:hypothetical protein
MININLLLEINIIFFSHFILMTTMNNFINERPYTSGIIGPGSKFIRRDANSRNQDYHDVKLSNYEYIRSIIGILIYIIIFIIIIPITLYRLKFTNFLKLYFLNTDLIATTISYDKGIFKNIFKYIYNDTGPLIGFLSQCIINWFVLMGLFYIIVSESCKKSITHTLSIVGFMLFISYLLPARFVIKLQEWFYKFIGGKNMYNNIDINGIITILFGLILIVIVISFEDFIVKHYSYSAKNLLDYIFKLLK